MFLPRKMLTLHLLWYLSSLRGAQLSEAVGWSCLGKRARQLLLQTSPGLLWVAAWAWLQGGSEAGAAFLPAWAGVLQAQDHQPGAVLSPTAKGALSGGSAQTNPAITAWETCKTMRGNEERYRCKHPEGEHRIGREEMWIINLKISHVSLIWTGCWLTMSWGGSGRYENEASTLYHCLQFLPALFYEAPACWRSCALSWRQLQSWCSYL